MVDHYKHLHYNGRVCILDCSNPNRLNNAFSNYNINVYFQCLELNFGLPTYLAFVSKKEYDKMCSFCQVDIFLNYILMTSSIEFTFYSFVIIGQI